MSLSEFVMFLIYYFSFVMSTNLYLSILLCSNYPFVMSLIYNLRSGHVPLKVKPVK